MALTVGHFDGPEHLYPEKTDGERRKTGPGWADDAGDARPATVVVIVNVVGGEHRRETSHVRIVTVCHTQQHCLTRQDVDSTRC